MNLIAVLLKDNGETCSWLDKGTINLYKKENKEWIELDSIPFSINIYSNINILRESLSSLIERLNDCRIFIGKEVSGLLFSILDTNNFHIYELSGIPANFLDSILSSEEKFESDKLLLTKQSESIFLPSKVDTNGNYTINLKNLLPEDRSVTSKQILLPFLKNEKFKTLEVICDHIPKWFDRDLSNMGYDFHITDDKTDVTIALIYPINISKTLC